jgi:carbonic anhydrase
MTAPPLKAGDSTTQGLWAFDRDPEWPKRYPLCNKKTARVSPLNIDVSNIADCSALCRLTMNYQPTTCSISMINNIPTVTFSPNCLMKFKDSFYFLRKMTLHHTSMHTINDSYADLEILLYHNTNPISDADGGVILSILFKKGSSDYGPANEFMNEFINQMPANDMPVEEDVDVSSTWSPEQLFPTSKSFFYYDGALPYPPCTPNWTFIIFEETVPISISIIDTIKYMIGPGNKNIRPIQRTPKDITIFYNANTYFDSSQDMSNADTSTQVTLPVVNALGSTSWLKRNIYYIKGIIITLVLILMIYIAIKISKIIVTHDLLNSFIIKQLKKKQQQDYDKSQKHMANQQAAEYGGIAPVEAPPPNNNANNAAGNNASG